MTTMTQRPGTAPQYGGGETRRWTTQHPALATASMIVAAVMCGVLVGILFNTVMSGADPVSIHRGGGGNARVAAVENVHQTLAAQAGVTAPAALEIDFSAGPSPARGGFAVARTVGAGRAWPAGATAGAQP